jgi:hypothetical protein
MTLALYCSQQLAVCCTLDMTFSQMIRDRLGKLSFVWFSLHGSGEERSWHVETHVLVPDRGQHFVVRQRALVSSDHICSSELQLVAANASWV